MSKAQLTKYIGVFFVLLTLNEASKSNHLPFVNTTLTWIINASLIFLCIIYSIKQKLFLSKCYLFCSTFLIWALVGAIRGIYYFENYWIVKNYISGLFSISLPIFAYVFSRPEATLFILRFWNKFIFPSYLFVFSWLSRTGTLHFYLGPIYFLYGVFFRFIYNKWKYLILYIVLFMLVANIGARSQVIKAAVCIMMAIAIYFKKYIPIIVVKIASISFYFLALTFLYLGITGKFNIFDHTDYEAMNKPLIFQDGHFESLDLANGNLADTRSFIYIEVILSALDNDYVLCGRTIARGNDSETFKAASMTGYAERYRNELCHLTIFTWLGLVGVVLYSFIYFQASILSSFFSNNIYLTYLGALVSFHWLYGWIEDMNNLNPMNIALWMIIGMCISPYFRKMNNLEFELWFKSIFANSRMIPYTIFKILKLKKTLSLFISKY